MHVNAALCEKRRQRQRRRPPRRTDLADDRSSRFAIASTSESKTGLASVFT
jgi:hypothetical protein